MRFFLVHSPQFEAQPKSRTCFGAAVHSLVRMKMVRAFCLLSFVVCLSPSCTPDPVPTLNFQERGVVDSLYKLQIDSLKIVFDSLCEVRHDSAVQFKVDSMMQERQAEIERYLERIRNSQ